MSTPTKHKIVIIVRHAHRNKENGSDIDNGLSKKGRSQAKEIKRFFNKNFKGRKPVIFSSPKRRCTETVEEIAKANKVKVLVSSFLDEGGDVQAHVDQFLKALEKQDSPLTVVCSHGDVIPILLQKMTGAALTLDKGGWAQVEEREGHFELEWLFQNFEFN